MARLQFECPKHKTARPTAEASASPFSTFQLMNLCNLRMRLAVIYFTAACSPSVLGTK